MKIIFSSKTKVDFSEIEERTKCCRLWSVFKELYMRFSGTMSET